MVTTTLLRILSREVVTPELMEERQSMMGRVESFCVTEKEVALKP